MDTPDRRKLAPPPPSKFEDSPVFNFISNLSPIQPVKSVDSIHIATAYQSFNYASLTSIFSSPHANPQKETKKITRSPFTDITRQQSSSDNVEEYSLHTGVAGVRLSACATTEPENCTIICSINEASTDPPIIYPSIASSSTQSVQFNGGSPDHNVTPCYGIKMDVRLNVEYTPVELIHAVENDLESRKTLFSTETSCHECTNVQDKDAVGCDWEDLIAENEESLLVFDSQAETGACEMVHEESRDTDADNLQCLQVSDNDERAIQIPPNSSADFRGDDGVDDASNELSSTNQNQADNQQQRGIRRRCLVFEMSGMAKGNVHNASNLTTSISVPFKADNISNSNYPKPAIRPSPCALPGIGLHLNTLASTSRERMSSKDNIVSGRKLINAASSIGCFPSMIAENYDMSKCKTLDTIRNDLEDIRVNHNEQDMVGNCEELSQGSPKKKRRRSENGGDNDGCKRCNCKKSKCLKLYCECFSAGVYCSEPCSCQGCFNKPIHEEMVLSTRKQIESRNPLAFAPKVVRSSEAGQEIREEDNKTPASARHKRGCNCKKSSCLKKYCECYQGGVGCSVNCRCEGCKNAFGKKEGILALVEAIEQGEQQNNPCEEETNELGEDQQNTDAHSDDCHSQKDLVPITPFKSCSLSVDLPFTSHAKPPRSSKFSTGNSAGLFGNHMLLKPEALLLERKFERNVDTILDDDTPAILRSAVSPTKGVMVSSPNRKRVSPPHNAIGLTPNKKGGRKLTLHSIPTFPSLSSDISTENPVGYSSNFTSSASR